MQTGSGGGRVDSVLVPFGSTPLSVSRRRGRGVRWSQEDSCPLASVALAPVALDLRLQVSLLRCPETSICAQPLGCFLSAHTHPSCGVPAERSPCDLRSGTFATGMPAWQAASVSTEILHLR